MKFHILIVRFSAMGDVVLPTGLLAQMKKIYGDNIEMSFVTTTEFAGVVQEIPFLDRMITFNRREEKLSELFKRIKNLHQENPIHLILDLHSTMRSALLRWRFMNLPRLVVDKRRIERTLLTKFKINFLDFDDGPEFQIERLLKDFDDLFALHYQRHDLENYLEKMKHSKSLSLTSYSFKDYSFSMDQWGMNDGKTICLFPSASFEPKRWSVESFKKLTDLIMSDERYNDYQVAVLAGPKDSFCEQFNDYETKYSGRFFNLYGKTNLDESAWFTSKANLCVGNDTGLLHISESLGTPVIMIFGPTSESYGFYPHLKNSKAISLPIWCRPCSTTGKKKCFRKEQYCLTGISPENVFEQVGKSLEVR
jgi:heptosyltransferase-2